MINIYVDDLRDCPIGFVVARTYQQAIHLLENNEVDILSLVHDLGEDLQGNLPPTGYDLVKYICEKGYGQKKYIFIRTTLLVERICIIHYMERNEEVSLIQILKFTTILLLKINIPNEGILNI